MTESDERDVLQNWSAFRAGAELIDRHEGFSGARVCRVRTANHDFALRAWPIDVFPRSRLMGLHKLLAFAFQRGMNQLSVPLISSNGTTIVEHQRRMWQLEPWMPGEATYHRDPSDDKLRSAMEILARFHLTTGEYQAETDHIEWFSVSSESPSPTVIERVRVIDRWREVSGPELARRIRKSAPEELIADQLSRIVAEFQRHAPAILAELEALLSQAYRLQPALRDVWHDHVLYVGDQVSGLIDAGACRSENPCIDLSRLLGSLSPGQSDQRRRGIELYEALRPLRDNEFPLLRAFDRSEVLLSGMTWVQRLIFERDRPVNLCRVSERLNRILARLPELEERT